MSRSSHFLHVDIDEVQPFSKLHLSLCNNQLPQGSLPERRLPIVVLAWMPIGSPEKTNSTLRFTW
jgi:hypothetical protein